MYKAFCLLVVLLGTWCSGLGQSATKLKYPRIVATFERVGQTAPIPPTIVYTPKAWGTFRCSVVMVGTVANGSTFAAWGGGFQIIDGAGENGPDAPFGVQLYTQKQNTVSTEFPIRAKAGKPIKFVVNDLYGGTEGTKYNVWVVVEQLM